MKWWVSSGMTSSSKGTPAFSKRRTRSVVWLKRTLRSSSPWIKRTGDFQVAMDEMGEDFQAMSSAAAVSGGFS
jgi:hypothetical protein